MAGDRVQRRLAAILAADVAGFSRLVRGDEEGSLARLNALRKEVIDPSIAAHGGRIVKLMGDGILAEFASVVDAVRNAALMQQRVADHQADVPEDQRIVFRIGINLGDVVIDGDDIQGDGVNVAARLEQLAEPGGVCISGGVHDQVRRRLDVAFEDLGPRTLKNIDEPVQVWRWVMETSAAKGSGKADKSLPLPDKPSIAVLPFDNMSGDPEQEYFSDGIADDIITALSKFRWFFVTARNSSFSYKGRASDIRRIGRELGVRYVLEGGVRKAGNRVRVTGQLIDASNGAHIWAERFDRDLEDIFAVQDEITAAIVGAVEPELAGAERARSTSKPSGSLGAWDHYQRGMWHFWRFTKTDSEAAQKHLEKAIALDPDFSSPHSALSYVLFYNVMTGWSNSPDTELAEAYRTAQTALQLDEQDPFAHLSAGRICFLQGQIAASMAEIERALELNPNFALAAFALGWALNWSGRAAESLPYIDRAIRQSPNDPLLWGFEMVKGLSHFWTGETDAAVTWLERSSRHPNVDFWPHANLAVVLSAADRLEEAKASLALALEKRPGLTVSGLEQSLLRNYYPEYKKIYLANLRKAGLAE